MQIMYTFVEPFRIFQIADTDFSPHFLRGQDIKIPFMRLNIYKHENLWICTIKSLFMRFQRQILFSRVEGIAKIGNISPG